MQLITTASPILLTCSPTRHALIGLAVRILQSAEHRSIEKLMEIGTEIGVSMIDTPMLMQEGVPRNAIHLPERLPQRRLGLSGRR